MLIIDIFVKIGNIDTKDLSEIVNILSSSLYYDDNFYFIFELS